MSEPRILTCAAIYEQYHSVPDPSVEGDAQDVQLVGTLVFFNRMGNDAYYLRALDTTGGIQLYCRRDTIEDFDKLSARTKRAIVKDAFSAAR